MDQYQFIITRHENNIYYGYYQGDLPVELYCQPEDSEDRSLVGNIYAARVEKVVPDIGAAFLELGEGKKCYYALPKNGTKPVLLSPEHRNRKDRMLYAGDIILAQVSKDPVKSKLPVADGNISFAGKYSVLTLSDVRLGISRKIKGEEERKRLSEIGMAFTDDRCGVIMRTNACGVASEELARELSGLKKQYEELMRRASIAPGKSLLYQEAPHYINCPMDLPREEMGRILTDQKDIHDRLLAYYGMADDREILSRIELYQDDYPLYKLYRMKTHYDQAQSSVVWLPSGGSLVIEPTEAMVVIDVNTAGVTKKKKKEDDLFYQINREAAKEIGRQLRLRNLSGIIVIDFINMRYESHQTNLLNYLREICAKDRIRTHVVDITALNLVEMTRQKVRKPLHEQCKKQSGQ